jgi:DNA invertase Pin-like site-specific DNA recombinase
MVYTMNAAIYCRVSTEEQAEHGVSLAAQEESLRQYCSIRGFEVAAVFVDAGVSASKPLAARPAGKELLASVRRKRVGTVVAFKLDRLFRNAGDCLAVTEAWARANVALHLLDLGGQAIDTSTAAGKFFLTMIAGVAEMERNLISERTKAALAHKRAKGERTTGHAPFGSAFVANGEDTEGKTKYSVVTDDNEQQVLERVAELHAGGASVRGIAAKLDAEGFKPRGKRWHPTTVARLLKRLDAA